MSQRKETLLVVEDDKQMLRYICFKLKQEGFSYRQAETAQCALSMIGSEKIDLIILDLGLEDMDGMEIIQRVRQWSLIPIVVVSCRDKDHEKAEALDAGADDYLTKPFSPIELMARIRVALRHASQNSSVSMQPVMQIGDLQLDLEKRLVFLRGEEIHLTPLEYRLLCLFFRNAGKVLTSQYIIREVYGTEYGSDTRALRKLLMGLRHKIEQDPANPTYILTEIGVDYRFRAG